MKSKSNKSTENSFGKVTEEKVANLRLIYECAKSEYLRECERERIIESKAQIFIGILVTFIALIIQNIPFKKISDLFKLNNDWIQYSIILSILVVIIPVFIVLYNLVTIINVKPHARFAIKELKNERLLILNEEKMYNELINHYYLILEKEEQQNELLASKLKNGILGAVIIIVVLVVGIIILNIIFGGKANV